MKRDLLTDLANIPQPAQALLDIVRIKWIAVKIGIEKILLKNNLLIANFVSDPNSQFYRSSLFVSIMNYVNRKQKTDEYETKSIETEPYNQ